MRSSIFLFISLILLQSGGLFYVFQIEQMYSQYHQNLFGAQTQFMVIDQAEFEKSHFNTDELSINDKMYDILAFRTISGKVHMLVVNDSNEEQIFRIIKNVISEPVKSNSINNRIYSKLISLTYDFHSENKLIYFSNLTVSHFILKCKFIVNPIFETYGQPPEFSAFS